jgi:hypothetical protein
MGLSLVVSRARVLVHEVLDRGAQAVVRGGACCAQQGIDIEPRPLPPAYPKKTAVASRRAKYVVELRVLTLFGAPPRTHNFLKASDVQRKSQVKSS